MLFIIVGVLYKLSFHTNNSSISSSRKKYSAQQQKHTARSNRNGFSVSFITFIRALIISVIRTMILENRQ